MLAIVIPYYKISYFEKTLQSLKLQKDKRFTVYIGDDASPERPQLLLQKFTGAFDFTYHRFGKNLGKISLTNHWERCIGLIKDEKWISILGDDDVLDHNFVDTFYNNLEEINSTGTNVVRFATQLIDAEDNQLSAIFTHPNQEMAVDFICRKFSGNTRSSLSEYIFKKDAFVKHGFRNYPLAWHSDDMAFLEFAEKQPIFTINESVVKVRISESSLSGSSYNIAEKRLAESFFYMDLINEKLHLFAKKDRIFLLYQLEDSIKKSRKLDFNEWFLLFKNYMLNFSIVPFLKFLRRFLISLVK